MSNGGSGAGSGTTSQPDESTVTNVEDDEKKSEEFSASSRYSKALWGASLGVIFGAAAVGTAVLTVGFFSPDEDFVATPRTLAALLIGGLLTFLFGLGAVVALFTSLDLDRGDQPLGLPEGSVQAFIALFLILLFFVMSVFIYINVSTTSSDRTLRNLTQASVDELRADGSTQIVAVIPRQVQLREPASDGAEFETVFDVVIAAPVTRSDVADEIGRQLVTTIGTLIVAIAAFYFGAKTVQERGPVPISTSIAEKTSVVTPESSASE